MNAFDEVLAPGDLAEVSGHGALRSSGTAQSGAPPAAIDETVLSEGPELYADLSAVVSARTLDILERRRRTVAIRRRGWLIRRMLLLADVVGLTSAWVIAELPLSGRAVSETITSSGVLPFLVTLPGWVLTARLYGLYDRDEERTDHSTIDEAVAVFHFVTIGTWIMFVAGRGTGFLTPSLRTAVTFSLAAVVLVSVARGVARWVSRRQVMYLQNAVIVGAGEIGQLVAHKLLQHPEYGINLVGFVDAEPKERREDLAHLTVLGPPERLPALVRQFDVERVIFAFSRSPHEQSLDLIRSLKDLDVQVDIVPRLFDIVGPSVSIHTVEGVPLMGLPPPRLSRSSRLLKRTLDLALATAALVMFAPLFVVIGILIKIGSRGPVFFRQVRMGSEERTFRIYKFRTMVEDADVRKGDFVHLNKHAQKGGDPRMFKIPDDPRITRIGRLLRRSSLDELPQLFNVWKGEMSLVGPRPLILDEDRYIREWGRRRLSLKPGITGLWQVLGRSEIPFEEMVKLDYLYVTNWSISNDIKLVLQTVPALLRTRGAY
jgi:exopolysaccharide biosynthesis polyprenyl glycosylphosphotransferase